MFDLANRQSFLHVKKWIQKVRELCEPNVVIMVIGNKNDVPHREVTSAEI